MKNLTEFLPAIWFYLFAVITVGSALCVVGLKNIVHCAIYLAATFLGVAAVYLLLHAEFIAVVQVLIYVGAVTVLILFAIMLSQKYSGMEIVQHNSQSIPAFFLAAAFIIGMAAVVSRTWVHAAKPMADVQGSAQSIGYMLMQPYVIPFEIASLLLLAALIGAIIIAKKDIE